MLVALLALVLPAATAVPPVTLLPALARVTVTLLPVSAVPPVMTLPLGLVPAVPFAVPPASVALAVSALATGVTDMAMPSLSKADEPSWLMIVRLSVPEKLLFGV